MQIDLPWPPSVNHYWRNVNGRTLISADGRRYRRDVIWRVKAECVSGLPFDGPLAVVIYAYPPDKRRRDLDNLLKSLLDSMQHAGVYVDDSQIERLAVIKVAGDKRKGLVQVNIKPAEDCGWQTSLISR